MTTASPISKLEETRKSTYRINKQPTSPYVLLFCILFLAAIATWIIPAGQFDRVLRNGGNFIVPHSLKAVTQHEIGPGEIFTSITRGMIDSAPFIFLILFTGGAFAVLERTGAVHAVLNRVDKGSFSQDILVIISICVIFSLLGTIGVVTNSVVAFIPVGLLVARSIQLPAVFGVGLVYLGTYSGFNNAILNPATTGLSQRLAELPMFSGLLFRVIIYLLSVTATIVFLAWNVRAYRKSPNSNKFDLAGEAIENAPAPKINTPITRSHVLVLSFTAISLIIFTIGAVEHRWAEIEMISMFIIIAIGAGAICKLSPNEIADEFLTGSGKLIHGALVVGLARAISIVLSEGRILDPIVNFLSDLLEPLHPMLAAIGMFFSAAMMHIAISSGSGESAALIPIFTPLGDSLNLTRQLTVQAVLSGEGIMNCFNPTSGVLMAVLATAQIPYVKWVKFIAPLILMWLVICLGTLIIGVWIRWGPF